MMVPRNCWLFIALLLVGCTQQPRLSPVPAEPAPDWPEIADEILDVVPSPLVPGLDVGVVVFEDGLTDKAQEADAAVRAIEVRLMAHRLRQALESSGAWGAVRILPTPSVLVPLQVTGQVVHSDGGDLVLDIEARDSTDRLWLAERFHGRSARNAYPVKADEDPFDPMWAAIANRLLVIWRSLPVAERERMLQIAELRYAASLAPDAFSDYLRRDEGGVDLLRLPAEDDPMLGRIVRIREYEYLFIDSIDEQFVDLQREVGPTYNAWREVTRAQSNWMQDYQERVAARSKSSYDGEFASLHAVYATYRSVRIQQQDLFDFAQGFSNESSPTVLEYDNRVIELDGTLKARYRQWQQLLRDILRLEQGSAN